MIENISNFVAIVGLSHNNKDGHPFIAHIKSIQQ